MPDRTDKSQATALATLDGQTTTSLETALILHGISRTAGYRAAATAGLPFPVLRTGRKYRVPVAPLLESLGIKASQLASPR